MSLKEEMLKSIGYGRSYGIRLDERRLKERWISKEERGIKEMEGIIRKNRELLGEEEEGEEAYKEKMRMAERLAKKMAFIFRDILVIGVSGSVSSEYPKEEDDIDLMIIVREETIWKNRFWLRVLVFIFGIKHREAGVKGKKNEFCFNLWLEEGSLAIPEEKRNLKNAMDFIMTKVIINRENCYERYWSKNEWVGDYLKSEYERRKREYEKEGVRRKRYGKLRRGIRRLFNELYFWPQYLYMKGKMRGEVVTRKMAFFHPSSNNLIE